MSILSRDDLVQSKSAYDSGLFVICVLMFSQFISLAHSVKLDEQINLLLQSDSVDEFSP